MSKRINREDIDRLHDCDLYVSTRTLTLFGDIDRDACERVVKNMHILNTVSDAPITVLLNSDGGDITQGRAIYEVIAASRSHVTIVGMGEVASMATAILQAADTRLLLPGTEFMIHAGDRAISGNVKEFKSSVAVADKDDEWYEQLLMRKITEVHPHFQLRTLRAWLATNTYFTSEEAVSWGLAGV